MAQSKADKKAKKAPAKPKATPKAANKGKAGQPSSARPAKAGAKSVAGGSAKRATGKAARQPEKQMPVKSKVKTPVKPATARKTSSAAGKPAAKALAQKKAPAKLPVKATRAASKGKATAPARTAAKPAPAPQAAAPAKSVAVPKPDKAEKAAADKRSQPDHRVALPTPPKSMISRKAHGKLLTREFLFELGKAIRTAVEPLARSMRGRDVSHTAPGGDVTFEIDKVAERALLVFLKNARLPIAYYSEDSGYSTFSNDHPKNLLIVDPIDGTRAAKSGFEGCVISIAATRIIERPTMADVDQACVVEILNDRIFYAERGKGTRVYEAEHQRKPKLTDNTDLERMAWSMTVPARPAELIFPVSARLVDLSSLKGGFFACNSTSYSLTRLVTGQLDGTVDFANRFIRDIPNEVRDSFVNAGRGAVMGIAPYDLAGGLLIAQEAGVYVTDAYGRGFDHVMLLDSTEGNQQSMIAASSQALHGKLLSYFDTRIKQFEALLKRRAQAS